MKNNYYLLHSLRYMPWCLIKMLPAEGFSYTLPKLRKMKNSVFRFRYKTAKNENFLYFNFDGDGEESLVFEARHLFNDMHGYSYGWRLMEVQKSSASRAMVAVGTSVHYLDCEFMCRTHCRNLQTLYSQPFIFS